MTPSTLLILAGLAATPLSPAGVPAASTVQDVRQCLDASAGDAESRVKACTRALAAPQGAAERERLLLARGRTLNDLERYAAAEADGETAVAISPKDPDALVLRGEARSFAEKNDAAMTDFDAALKLAPDDATALMRRAQIWQYNRADPAKARADYDAAIKADPGLAIAWYFRGVLRSDADDYAGAAADFVAAWKIAPDHSEYARALGAAYEHLDRRPEAIAIYDELLEKTPKDAETLTYRASARRDDKNWKGALADAEAAIAQDPTARRAYRIKADVLDKQGDLEGAIAASEAGLRYKRDDEPILFDLGGYYRRADKLDLSRAALEAAVKAKPDDAEDLVALASVLDALGKGDDALPDYDSAIKLDAKSANARNERGRHWLGVQDYKAALADFDAAIALDPKFDAAYYNRGVALKFLDRRDQAIAAFDAYLVMNPGDAEALSEKGDCYRLEGDDALAVTNLDAAIKANPALALAWWRRGLAKADLGDDDAAAADKAHARKLDPHIDD
jgi:tetratricopeptide (TPR) repeat protein